jgi:Uma2 family endonuclease
MDLWSPALAERDTPTARMSIQEWAALPEDTPGELVDGYLTEEEVPDPLHGLAVTWLIAAFRSWLGAGRGFVFDPEVKFAVSGTRGRRPDISVYFPNRPAPPRRGAIDDPPDIMVEVVSPSPRDERRDRVEKMEEYAAFGVTFYWLLDPALGSLEIFELQRAVTPAHYARVLARVEGAVDRIPGCDGLVIDLDELWAELRRLNAGDHA